MSTIHISTYLSIRPTFNPPIQLSISCVFTCALSCRSPSLAIRPSPLPPVPTKPYLSVHIPPPHAALHPHSPRVPCTTASPYTQCTPQALLSTMHSHAKNCHVEKRWTRRTSTPKRQTHSGQPRQSAWNSSRQSLSTQTTTLRGTTLLDNSYGDLAISSATLMSLNKQSVVSLSNTLPEG